MIVRRTPTTVRTTSNGTLTVNAAKPSDLVEGDFMLCFLVVGETGATAPVFSPPAGGGWTHVVTISDNASGPANYVKIAAYSKVATASEPSTYAFTTTLATTSRFAATIVAYGGVEGIEVSNGSNGDTANNTNRVTGSITTTGDRRIIFQVADRNNSTFSGAPSGYVQLALTNGQTPGGAVYDSDGELPAGTFSYTLTSSTSSSTTAGLIIALIPAAEPEPEPTAVFWRWDSTTSSYIPQDLWRWNGTTYVPVDVA